MLRTTVAFIVFTLGTLATAGDLSALAAELRREEAARVGYAVQFVSQVGDGRGEVAEGAWLTPKGAGMRVIYPDGSVETYCSEGGRRRMFHTLDGRIGGADDAPGELENPTPLEDTFLFRGRRLSAWLVSPSARLLPPGQDPVHGVVDRVTFHAKNPRWGPMEVIVAFRRKPRMAASVDWTIYSKVTPAVGTGHTTTGPLRKDGWPTYVRMVTSTIPARYGRPFDGRWIVKKVTKESAPPCVNPIGVNTIIRDRGIERTGAGGGVTLIGPDLKPIGRWTDAWPLAVALVAIIVGSAIYVRRRC